jgi:DNA-binding NtrC family response regulator
MRAQLEPNGPWFDSIVCVDDDPCCAATLDAWAVRFGVRSVRHAASVRAGLPLLAEAPTLLVVEACLPDGDCSPLVRAVRARTVPSIVVVTSGRAGRRLIASLLGDGADAYIEKPVTEEELCSTLASLTNGEELCRRVARRLVGRIGLKEAQECLRGTMHLEALTRTGGSRRAAAHVLRVHRRYVQRMVDEHGHPYENAVAEREA